MKKKIFLLFSLITTALFAQLDSKHYLPPLKQAVNNQAFSVQRIYLSTPETVPFDVNIYVGTSATPIVIQNLANGAPKTYNPGNGDNNRTLVTNANTGKVLQGSGLRFESSGGEKFYVNWRGRSGAQAGSLTCKGTKALGRDFRWGGIPNVAKKQATLNTSLGIMATENGTTVVINGYDPNCVFRNGTAVGGHTQDQFTINLEKGETYVLEAFRDAAPTANDDGWLGARITSNNPIATSMGGMNVGIRSTTASRDVGIDQAVPTNVLGRDYVFIRGNGNDESEFPIIVGTQNNTEIKVNGIVVKVINDGEYYQVPGSNYSSQNAGASMFVETSKAAYAFQCLTGRSKAIQTIGMNFIAPVNCLLPSVLSEISNIDFIVTTKFTNGLTIIASTTTPDAAFTVTENGTSIGAITSTPVPGTSEWKSFYVTGLVGRVSVTSSGGGFAAGVFMTDNKNAGVAGYFSGFDTSPVVDLDVTGGGCFPGTALKEITGGFDAYQWYYNGAILPGETGDSLLPNGIGDYFVEVTKAGCTYPSAVLSIYNCDPDINVVKTADTNTIEEGDEVEFTVTVKSLGIFPVTNLKIEDALPSPLSLVSATPTSGTFSGTTWDIGTMTSGEVQSIKIVATALVGTEGASVVNMVSNTQTEVDSNRTPDDLVEPVKITDAEIQLTKEATLNDGGDGIVNVGDLVTYTFKVTNHGEVPLKTIVLTDPFLGGVITATPTGDNGNNQLDLTEEWVYVVNYSITQTDINLGSITNTATVTGVQPNGNIQSDISDDPKSTAEVDTEGDGEPDDPTLIKIAQTPVLNLVKKAVLNDGGDGLQVGDKIDYTLTVTNTGNTAYLENVVLNDPLLGGNLTGPTSGDNGDSRLDLSETWIYEVSYTLTKTDLDLGQVTNSATVSADAPGGTPSASDVSDDPDNPLNVDTNFNGNPDDPTVFNLPKSDLEVRISPDIKQACVGGTVVFTVQLSNKSLNSDLTATAASNIVVQEILPVGYTYVNHTTSTGIYVPGTGLWTVGNLAKEVTTSLTITTTVNTSTATTDEYVNKTEIIAVDQYDPNSNVLVSVGIDDFMDGVFDNDESMVEPTITETPVIALGTITQISACGVEDGSILLTGLVSGETYGLRYKKDSNQTNTSLVADGTGNILISNLPAGSYSDFEVELNGCTSNLLAGPVVITEPVTPVITFNSSTNPMSCGGTDGEIIIAGLNNSESYIVDYKKDGVDVNTTIVSNTSGELILSGLSSASYDAIKVTLSGCESNLLGPFTLTDPTAVTIVLDQVNHPTTCGGLGSLEFTGLDASTAYDVNYEYNTVPGTQNVTSDGTGRLIISVLGAGSYTNISVTNSGCTSNTISFAVINPPVITLGDVVQPTTCGGTGSYEINGLVANETYNISHQLNGDSAVLTSLTADTTGKIIHSGLVDGTYSDIKAVTSTGCESNSVADVILLPLTPPTIVLGTVESPNSCVVNNGSIQITGLSNNVNYEVSFNLDSNPQTINLASDNAGSITLTNLGAANYTLIKVKNSTTLCESNTLSQTLALPVKPTAPTVGAQEFCDSAIVSDLTATIGSGEELLWYDMMVGGVELTATTALASQDYYAVAKSLTTGCESARVMVAITIKTLPSIGSFIGTNPTTCLGADGLITLSGLTNGTTYLTDYKKNGIAELQLSLTADTSGEIVIPSLSSGSYSDISITENGCVSTLVGPVVLTDPPLPIIGGTVSKNPTTCSGTEGTITLTGLNITSTYLVKYKKDSFVQFPQSLTTDGAGDLTILSLGEGVYSDITITQNNCTSLMSGPITLVDPPLPVITGTSFSNPTTCVGTDGSFTLEGLVAGETYIVEYRKDSGVITNTSIVANASGDVLVPNLTSGDYSDIAVVLNNCTSAREALITLTDPVIPVISNIDIMGPTTCLGTDGTIVLDGLENTISYFVDFKKDNVSQAQQTISSSATGSITIANLSAGLYSEIKVTLNNCVSIEVGPVTLTDPATPTLTLSTNTDPTTCLGTDGTIVIATTDLADATYVVNYVDAAVSSQTTNMVVVGNVGTISGLSSGTYNDIRVTNAGCTSVADIDVVLTDPAIAIIAMGIVNQISECGNTDGEIQLTGLNPSVIYSVRYKKEGAQATISLTADTNGNIFIQNLPVGTYTDFKVEVNACVSNVITDKIQIQEPETPIISLNSQLNPSTCSGDDGEIIISGLIDNQTYIVDYENEGLNVNITLIASNSGNLTLENLKAGAYNNINVTLNNCTSNIIDSVVLNDPGTPVIVLDKVNDPETCDGVGSIELSGLINSTTYTVAYTYNGKPSSKTVTSDTTGKLIVSILGAGIYENITVENSGCISNTIDFAVINPPVISLGEIRQPLMCMGTGSFVLKGLVANTTYNVNSLLNGVANSLNVTSDVDGDLTVSNLTAGVYTQIKVITTTGCESNAIPLVTIVDPDVPNITLGTINNPTNCVSQDGLFEIRGLKNNVNYEVSYVVSGVTITQNVTSNSIGELELNSLEEGMYESIKVKDILTGCISNELITTLELPTLPTVPTVTTQEFCGTATVANLEGTTENGTTLVWYDNETGGLPLLSTVTLVTGNYYAVSKNNSTDCESERIEVSVVLKEIPTISIDTTKDPNSCNGSEGEIVLRGLNANTNYNVEYTYTGNVISNTISSNSLGTLEIQNLNSGFYSAIKVTLNGCDSNTVNTTLNNPIAPEVTLGNISQISTCGIVDGSITLNNLIGNENYVLEYEKDGFDVLTNITTNSLGNYSLLGLPEGVYQNFQLTHNNCISTVLTQSIQISEPITPMIALKSTINPSLCGDSSGGIIISGGVSGVNYTITYFKDGVVQTQNSIANNSGEIKLDNLGAGNYTEVKVEYLDCISNELNPITLNDPNTPTIVLDQINHPNTCSGTGSLEFIGLEVNETYTVNYVYNGTPDSRTITSGSTGNLNLAVLGAGLYENIHVVISGCTSNFIDFAVINPPVISLANVIQPSMCGGKGSLTIADLAPGETYEVSFKKDGVDSNVLGKVANIGGVITVDDLTSGIYSDIKVITNIGCESNSLANVILTDPTITNINIGTTINPTTCNGTEGSFEILGLENNENYIINYVLNSNTISKNMGSDTQGKIVISNLSEGNYTNITATSTITNCVTNELNVNLSVPLSPNSPVIVDQIFCGSATVSQLIESTVVNETLVWYLSNTSSTPMLDTDVLVSGTYYVASQNTNTLCESAKSSVEIIIQPCSDISITKSSNVSNPNVGDMITFSILINNNGPDVATGLGVKDVLPVGLSYVSSSASNGGDILGANLTWDNLTIPLAGLTLTYDVIVNAPTGVPNEYKNSAEVTSLDQVDEDSTVNNGDQDLGEDDESSTITLPQTVNLSLEITQNDMEPNVNQLVTFSVLVKNIGNDDASDVEITSLLPNGYTFVSSEFGNHSNGTIDWDKFNLAKGSQIVFTFVAKVNPPLTGVTYETIAEIINADQYDINSKPNNYDTNPSEDDEDSVAAIIPVVDLIIQKEINKNEFITGEIVEFTIYVENKGISTATGISVEDKLQAGYEYVSHTGGDYNSTSGIWEISELEANEQIALNIRAKVVKTTDDANYNNTATVVGLDQFDNDISSNSSLVTARLTEIDMQISKEVDKNSTHIGDVVTFTIKVKVIGNKPASNVIIEEQIPSGYNYISHTTTSGDYNESLSLWNLLTIDGNSTETLVIKAELKGIGEYVNIAKIINSDERNISDTTEASAFTMVECLKIHNEFSPNGDGKNEVLKIDCIENYPNSKLEIFNRWGNTVYFKKGYDNTFGGISNGQNTIQSEVQLPVGTYYYILDFGNDSEPLAGWIYINR